jgi:hypothetical protein
MAVQSKVDLKKLEAFPAFNNPLVAQALKEVGPLDLNTEGSIFSTYPE